MNELLGDTPRVELRAQWTALMDAAEATHRLTEFLSTSSITAKQAGSGVVIFEQGSQVKTRVIGAWLADPASLPKRGSVEIKSSGASRSQLDVHIRESLGFGVMNPILKRRYLDYFEFWMSGLKRAVPEMPPVQSRIAQLELLAQMRDRGILDAREFEDRKRIILG